eukprot:COSAG05_NODE_38_length_27626_cov_78.614306_9_plen_68_part_00
MRGHCFLSVSLTLGWSRCGKSQSLVLVGFGWLRLHVDHMPVNVGGEAPSDTIDGDGAACIDLLTSAR